MSRSVLMCAAIALLASTAFAGTCPWPFWELVEPQDGIWDLYDNAGEDQGIAYYPGYLSYVKFDFDGDGDIEGRVGWTRHDPGPWWSIPASGPYPACALAFLADGSWEMMADLDGDGIHESLIGSGPATHRPYP